MTKKYTDGETDYADTEKYCHQRKLSNNSNNDDDDDDEDDNSNKKNNKGGII